MSCKHKLVPQEGGRILIVGGYGQVGRSIAQRLAPIFPNLVTVAGRNLEMSVAAAAAIGHGVEGRSIDVFAANVTNELNGVEFVLVCLDQSDTRFVEQCFERGIHYVDISADYDFLSRVEKLDGLARQHGSMAILSVGVAPGLTNMLAAAVREKMKSVERIDILVELGLGDSHGKTAVEWMLDNLDASYEVLESGQRKLVSSFSEATKIRLPGQETARPAYRFNFSDQHVIARTLNVPTVSTWIRFDNHLSTWLFAIAVRAGLSRLLRRQWWRKSAIWLFMNVHLGSDICGVAARATAPTADDTQTLTLGLVGRKEALMTAIVAAETVRQLHSSNRTAGVFHIEHAIALGPIVTALKQDLPDLTVQL